jgi:hypothetical protein
MSSAHSGTGDPLPAAFHDPTDEIEASSQNPAVLSKNAQKRLLKAERRAETKSLRRAREKELKKQKKRARAEQQADDGPPEKKSRTEKRTIKPFNARVVIDLGFDELMSAKVHIGASSYGILATIIPCRNAYHYAPSLVTPTRRTESHRHLSQVLYLHRWMVESRNSWMVQTKVLIGAGATFSSGKMATRNCGLRSKVRPQARPLPEVRPSPMRLFNSPSNPRSCI